MFEVFQRIELSAAADPSFGGSILSGRRGDTRRGEPLPDELFGVFLPQSVYHAKSEPKRVVVQNRAAPIRFHDADRLDLHSVSLRIFDNCCRRIKTHWLIVEQTRVKFGCAMHFQICAAVSENGETDRVRFRKSVESK